MYRLTLEAAISNCLFIYIRIAIQTSLTIPLFLSIFQWYSSLCLSLFNLEFDHIYSFLFEFLDLTKRENIT